MLPAWAGHVSKFEVRFGVVYGEDARAGVFFSCHGAEYRRATNL